MSKAVKMRKAPSSGKLMLGQMNKSKSQANMMRTVPSFKSVSKATVAANRLGLEIAAIQTTKKELEGLTWWQTQRRFKDRPLPDGVIHPNRCANLLVCLPCLVQSQGSLTGCFSSNFMVDWSFLMVVAVGWYIMYVPYEIAFLTDRIAPATSPFANVLNVIVVSGTPPCLGRVDC